MPSEKLVSPLFGIFAISLSLFLAAKENAALAAQPRVSPYIVVIDPGHGGADTGTSGGEGPQKITEKDLSLAISLRLQRILQDPAYTLALGRPVKVVLTRTRDETVSLEKRSEMARRAGADLFVSVHANSDPALKAEGLETYFLNNTDEASSLKLQEIENRTSRRHQQKRDVRAGAGGGAPRGAGTEREARPGRELPREEALLLRSVAADAEVEASRRAAEQLHSSLVDYLRSGDASFQDRGVRQALLYVLLDSQVPAVLVECFFLSSREDREFLAQPENRDRIAEGLARGILRYLALK